MSETERTIYTDPAAPTAPTIYDHDAPPGEASAHNQDDKPADVPAADVDAAQADGAAQTTTAADADAKSQHPDGDWVYRSRSTGEVVRSRTRRPRFERLDNWQTIGTPDEPSDREAGIYGVDHRDIVATGVLARSTADQQAGRTQIGRDPQEHPHTTAELERYEAENRDHNADGVGTRSEQDSAEGLTQIGPNPEEHPRTPEELAEADRRDSAIAQQSGVLERAEADAREGRTQVQRNEHPDAGTVELPAEVAEAVERDQAAADAQAATTAQAETSDGTAEATRPEPPAQSALKPEWVDHAVASGMDRKTAEGMTKAELIAKTGGTQ